MCSFLWQKIIFVGFGVIILVAGGLMSVFWPIIFNQQFQKQLVLTNDSKSFHLWRQTPIPMYIDFYMFNWTNPEETLNQNKRPHFTEIGPYIFREEREKVNVIWNDNGTVTFKQVHKWVFQREESVGELSDLITNVNVIAMTIGNVIQKKIPKYLYPLINDVLKLEKKVYVTKTVRELLFDGYNDIFLDIAKKLEHILKIKLPMDKFGWFYNRNMSVEYDGIFNMMTGEETLHTLGLLRNWNYKNTTSYFQGTCGYVQGSTGELWPVNAASKSFATIFATDMCSKIEAERQGSTDIHGVTGTVFTGTEQTFNDDTKCYCINNVCHPKGVREVSTCRYGAPAFISFPHFYLADPSFREMVEGLEPSAEKHVFDLTLHKLTAVPLSVNARLQINILVDKIPGLNFYEKLRKAYMPMIWFNERALITPTLASELSELEILTWLEPGFFSLIVVGAVMFLIGLFLWNRKWKGPGDDPLLEENSSS